jgi:hypothetical protein
MENRYGQDRPQQHIGEERGLSTSDESDGARILRKQRGFENGPNYRCAEHGAIGQNKINGHTRDRLFPGQWEHLPFSASTIPLKMVLKGTKWFTQLLHRGSDWLRGNARDL